MANYTKLFSSILHSTIWQAPDHVRIVWITLLALKDRDGVVEASVPGLARAAGVSLTATEQALALLMAPDPYSRTPDHEGRRIVAVDGGWAVLNHDKYNDKSSAEEYKAKNAARQARLRARKAANVTLHNATVTQGNAESQKVWPSAPAPAPAPASASGSERDLVAAGDQPALLSMPERAFTCDLLAIYKRHPRHEGKAKGLAKLKAQIKSPADYADLERAHAAYLRSDPVRNGFVRHFDTWVNSWRDHLEPEHRPPERPYNGRG